MKAVRQTGSTDPPGKFDEFSAPFLPRRWPSSRHFFANFRPVPSSRGPLWPARWIRDKKPLERVTRPLASAFDAKCNGAVGTGPRATPRIQPSFEATRLALNENFFAELVVRWNSLSHVYVHVDELGRVWTSKTRGVQSSRCVPRALWSDWMLLWTELFIRIYPACAVMVVDVRYIDSIYRKGMILLQIAL